MSVKKQQNSTGGDQGLCQICHQFWGSPQTQNMCSKCYTDLKKDPVKAQKQRDKVEEKGSKQAETSKCRKGPQEHKNRCFSCRRKVGDLGIQCKCGYIYCNTHRLPEDHECDYNYEVAGKDKLKKQIVKVSHEKIQQV